MSKADTIAQWTLEKKPELVKEAIAKTSLDGALGHACCISWAFDSDDVQSVTWPLDVDSEAVLIYTFKSIVEKVDGQAVPPVICGHFIAGFDLRFLWQRAIILGIRMPNWFPFMPKSWDRSVFDTMSFAGDKGTISLENLCTALGIPGKDGFDGSMVADAWARGEYERIASYCRGDVQRVREVHRKMRIAMGER